MDLKGIAEARWYQALVVVGAFGAVGAFAIGNDSALRKEALLICIGAVLIGLGEWINHPLHTRFVSTPVGPGKATGYLRRWKLTGALFDLAGLIVAGRGLWLLW